MKIVLIQTPVWGTREPPLSIVQLAGQLKSRGFEVKSFDLNNYLYNFQKENYRYLWAWEQSLFWYNQRQVEEFFKDINHLIEDYIEKILEEEPDIIGMSVFASTYYSTVELIKKIKEKNKFIKIIVGGQLFLDNRYVENIFRNCNVDFVVIGEGEETLPELLTLLEMNKDISLCKGLYLKENNNLKFTGKRDLIKNLDNLAYMDFSDLKIDNYDDKEHILMMTSRGCVWNCYFCSSRNFWQGYRQMSAERIYQEIVYHRLVSKSTIQHFDFADLVFNADIKRVMDFCNLLIKYPPFPKELKIDWEANAIIVPEMNYDFFCLLKESGCERLFFGIESGSQEVLNKMNKPYKISDAIRVIKDATKANLNVTLNFMFGFPGETEEDFQKTLNFIEEVAHPLVRVYPSRTFCALEENSYIYKYPQKFGIKIPFNHHLYWETKDGDNTYPIRLKRC
ncbi:MAG: radical SAM protein, partial [Candidatus Micrarchaeia archaeon]